MYIPKPDFIDEDDWNEAWEDFSNQVKIKHDYQEHQLEQLGYDTKALYENQPHTNMLAPNGVVYKNSTEFYKGYGCMPCYKKGGVWYGMYETIKKHNIDDEIHLSDKSRHTLGWLDTDLGI